MNTTKTRAVVQCPHSPINTPIATGKVEVFTQLLDAGKSSIWYAHILKAKAHTEQQQSLDIDTMYFSVCEATHDQISTIWYSNCINVRGEAKEAALGNQLVLEQQQTLVNCYDHFSTLHRCINQRILCNLKKQFTYIVSLYNSLYILFLIIFTASSLLILNILRDENALEIVSSSTVEASKLLHIFICNY